MKKIALTLVMTLLLGSMPVMTGTVSATEMSEEITVSTETQEESVNPIEETQGTEESTELNYTEQRIAALADMDARAASDAEQNEDARETLKVQDALGEEVQQGTENSETTNDTTDTEQSTTDTEQGTTDTEQGTTNTEQGTTDTEQGTTDTEQDTEQPGGDEPSEEIPPVRILLVGNSFTKHTASELYNKTTYSVEVPLEELGIASGKNLDVVTLAHGSARLKYYAGMSTTYISYYRELINYLVNGEWDYIIFQEQTTAPAKEYEETTYPAVEELQKLVKRNQPNAKMLLYMTPGYPAVSANLIPGVTMNTDLLQQYVGNGYMKLKNSLGIDVVQVGIQYGRARLLYPGIELVDWGTATDPDGKHPPYSGYFIAAACIYEKIFHQIPTVPEIPMTHSNLTRDQLVALANLMTGELVPEMPCVALNLGDEFTPKYGFTDPNVPIKEITYSSFDKSIAKVGSKTGIVTAVGEGETTIVATTADGYQAYVQVSVTKPLSFNNSYYIVGNGDKIRVYPDSAQTNLKWTIGNKSIASITSVNGIVTALKPGKTTVKVTNTTDPNDTASYTLYVACNAPKGVSIEGSGTPAIGATTAGLKISWSSVSGASKYDIYRCESIDGAYEQIGSTSSRTYTDKTASVNKMYYYKVVAGNGIAQCVSDGSASVRGLRPGSTKLSAKKSSKAITVKWKKLSNATGYYVYRSTKKKSGYKKVKTITKNSTVKYKDTSVKKGKKYYYQIIPYRVVDGVTYKGVKSEILKVKK